MNIFRFPLVNNTTPATSARFGEHTAHIFGIALLMAFLFAVLVGAVLRQLAQAPVSILMTV
jgi:hypothetical protein